MYWIVLTDTNLCRIYSCEGKAKPLSLFKEIKHPESKKKREELVTDRHGGYQAGNKATRGVYVEHIDPQEEEIEHFWQQLAKEFEVGRAANQYKKLILIAAPRVSGKLIKHVDKNVKNLLINNIQKDYMHFKEHEIGEFVHDNWRELIAE